MAWTQYGVVEIIGVTENMFGKGMITANGARWIVEELLEAAENVFSHKEKDIKNIQG